MLVSFVFPAIGRAVSSALLATKEDSTPNGAGFVWAKKGAAPVGVGPVLLSNHRNHLTTRTYPQRARGWSESNLEGPRTRFVVGQGMLQ
jgi:hypothetical protein